MHYWMVATAAAALVPSASSAPYPSYDKPLTTDQAHAATTALRLAQTPVVQLVRPPTQKPKALAVLDASFNPPTRAHVHLLHAVSERYGASHRLLLLATHNADKPVSGASLAHRLQMMDLRARADAAGATICGVTAHPLFADKAAALRRLCGADVPIYLIVGFDTWVRVVDAKYYEAGALDAALRAIFDELHVVVVSRSSESASAVGDRGILEQEELVKSLSPELTRGRLHFLQNDDAMAGLSSSAIRRALARRERGELEDLPTELRGFVSENALYVAETS